MQENESLPDVTFMLQEQNLYITLFVVKINKQVNYKSIYFFALQHIFYFHALFSR